MSEENTTSTDSLKLKTFRGGLTLGGASIGLRVFSVFTSILLARLLDPNAFGQVALAQVILSIIAIFSTLGLPAAVIQTPLDKMKATASAFAVTFFLGLLVTVILIVAAPGLGFLLGEQEVVPVLQWLSLTVFLGGATRVPEALIQKELLFGRLSLIGIISEVVTVGVSIGLAWFGYGVWSLVYGQLVGATVYAVLAWVLSPTLAWFRASCWDPGILKAMMGFGVRMVGSTSVYTFYSYIDSYVVGRVLGTDALGYYNRAVEMTSKTVDSVNRTIGVVLFPSYAQVQGDRQRLSRAYLKSLRMIGMITIPIAAGLFAVAEELIPVLLGPIWTPAVLPLKVLTFMSLLKPLSSTTSALFIATGHPEYNLRAGLAVTFALLASIPLLMGWGPAGVALAVVIAHAVGLAYNVYQVQTLLPRTVAAMGEAVLPAFTASVIMVMAVVGARWLVVSFAGTSSTLPALLGFVALGVVVYVGVLMITQRPLLQEMVGLLRAKRGVQEVQEGA